MSTPDDEFIARLRATFNVEAEEHLHAISSMLLELEKLPPSSPLSAPAATLIENVYREAHTLKGAARAVDLHEIEAICQQLEGAFSAWKRQQSAPSPEAFDLFQHSVDVIRTLLSPGKSADDNRRLSELLRRIGAIQGSAAAPPVNTETMPAPSSRVPTHPVDAEASAPIETVRISSAKLDSRLLQAEEMLAIKAITAQRANDLRDITSRFRQWQREWSKVSSEARMLRQAFDQTGKSPAVASAALMNFIDWNSDFLRSLENKVTVLASQSGQDRHDIGKRVDDLLEETKKLLMLPFSTLANQFPKLVRDLCRDQNKRAELVIRGGDVEIDKRVLEEMKEALIHILRNCVDHGIETPALREQRGKTPQATITMAASPIDGNKVEILVSDDGGGIDLQRVKDSAVQVGVISETEARTLEDAEAMKLIFHSDVSASPIVTTISGRGLGMAIVQSKTEKLGGRVFVESKSLVGTSLRMVLPLTLATFRGILVTAEDRVFVMPTFHVERVLRVEPKEIQTIENREVISVNDRAISLVRLHSVLGLPLKPVHDGVSRSLRVVLLHSADLKLAVVVDQVLGEEEVLIKPLRKPLVRVQNIAGATILASGSVALVLNIADLIKTARTVGPVSATTNSPEQVGPILSKKILVVEDSITSRMLLKGILESAGYEVKTAVDGVEAFVFLREDQFDLVVSDVEMPRMNGFELTGRIRSDKRFGELPVVLITALESQEQRERGIDAGANAYIIKSSFDQQNLLEVVRRFM